MEKIFLAGIDEAGRGSALGPLGMAAVLAEKEQEEQLMELGVKESKERSKKERLRVAREIENIAEKGAGESIEENGLNELMPRKT